ncbi:hypothetical protein [Psychrobacter sp.]
MDVGFVALGGVLAIKKSDHESNANVLSEKFCEKGQALIVK